MTRLTEKFIENISSDWTQYEMSLQKQTGFSLLGLACETLNVSSSEISKHLLGKKVAAIPLTQGEGLISGFAASLASIATHLGFKADVLPADTQGFELYHKQNFHYAIYADATNFFVHSKASSREFDNNIATGRGFAQALHSMLSKDKTAPLTEPIVIRGCGPIGTHAAMHLAAKGYDLALFDLEHRHAEKLLHKISDENSSVSICILTKEQLQSKNHYPALLDAAPRAAQGDFFGDMRFDYISAPCVPCLWETRSLWHDPLQLGTAVMLIAALLDNNIYKRF